MLSNKVKEIMIRDVNTAAVTVSILDAMEMMVAKRVGRVIVTEKQVPVGIFTEQDVLKRVVNKKLNAKKTSIKKVMTAPIRAVHEEASIVDVLGNMYKNKFRHLLVRGDKKAMVGLVSMHRILRLAVNLGHDLEETQTIGSIMSRNLITVESSLSISFTATRVKTSRSVKIPFGSPLLNTMTQPVSFLIKISMVSYID